MNQLTRGNGNLAAVACQNHTLACGEAGITLFLHNHDGAAVVFTDFQLNALSFVHRALYALTRYATGHGTCGGCQRTACATANGVTQEATQHSPAECANDVIFIPTLDLNRASINNGTVGHVLNLFSLRCAIYVAGK